MSGNELSRDRKPETGTAGVSGPGIVEAHEPVEDPLPVVGRDAWPVVVDVEHDPSVGLGEVQGNRATRVARRIVGEISQHPTDGSGIGVDPASGHPRRVDVQVGTLSKAIGALGGYVAASRSLIEFLYHRARPFLFSTSHPPAVAAASLAALDVLEQEPQIIERLWENTRFFKAGLEALGFNTGLSQSPITPVIVGDGALAMKLSDRLFQEGVFAQGIAFPTVARDKARVRTIVTATHTRDELEFALDVFAKVGRELGILKPAGSDSRSVR